MSQEVRTRFAPSPTGYLHIGGLRTALFNFLFAKNKNGKTVLRIEDTDQTRLVPGAMENIIETLNQFKIAPDEGPIEQSKRLDIYKKYADELVNKGHAYFCFCSTERLEELRKQQEAQKLPPKYDKLCLKLSKDEVDRKIASGEKHVVRLNVPKDQTIRFTDLVHGEISISTNDIDDQVLLKSDGFPTYHLAVVVDDHEMNITHVIRGDEWIPSTPKHILLYSAFGWESPQHIHLPPILSKATGKKLSKREGDVSVKSFLEKGYLVEAITNFIAFQGWNPKSEKEIFSLDELIKEFDVKNINKAGAVFDVDKLDWINGLYIRKMDPEELLKRVDLYPGHELKQYPKEFLLKIVKLEQERLKKLSEIGERVRYFFEEPEYDSSSLVLKEDWREEVKEVMTAMGNEIRTKGYSENDFKQFILNMGKNGKLTLHPLRVALTGLQSSPPPIDIINAFMALQNGKEIILKRIERAINLL
jgi:nondiscriminating glutamyl-tRNA synthetase